MLSNTMRRLLFLSFWVPPRKAIGSIRSAHLLKHLPKYGWDITVVTPRLDAAGGDTIPNYVETGYWDLKEVMKRAIGMGGRGAHDALKVDVPVYGEKRTLKSHIVYAASSLVTYPDDYVGWLPFATRTLGRLTAREKWDAVLSSAPPWTGNLAAALARRNVPWIADFRDLWAENDYSERSKLQAWLDEKLERATLSRAAALTASSELSADLLRERYPGKPCTPISSGFDIEEWRAIDFGSERACTFLYAGNLYRGHRDPSMLFAATREILDQGLAKPEELRIEFYSPREPWLLKLIASYGLEDVAVVHGFVDRQMVLAAERRADRLIVLCWDGQGAEGVVAGKLFEYLGARRPILAIGGPAKLSVEDILTATGAGVRSRTVAETKADVLNALAEHRSGHRRVIPEHAVRSYSGEECARQFAEVLESVVNGSSARVSPHSSNREAISNVS